MSDEDRRRDITDEETGSSEERREEIDENGVRHFGSRIRSEESGEETDGVQDAGEQAPEQPEVETAPEAETAAGAEGGLTSGGQDGFFGQSPEADGPSGSSQDDVPQAPEAETGAAGTQAAGTEEAAESSTLQGDEHDFDDEPKFDTQTGERLDKPKSKAPGIILTAAVTAALAGSFVFAVNPKGIPSVSPDDAAVETEQTQLQTVQEETEAPLQIVGGETEPAAAALTAPESEAETEGDGQTGTNEMTEESAAAQTEAEVRTETETEASGTESTPETKSQDSAQWVSSSSSDDSVSYSLDVSDMVAEALPSIVSITSQSIQTVQSFFYGEQQIEVSNVGSGIIVSEDDDSYYIVTDAYLAERAEDFTVGFSVSDGSGRESETEAPAADEQKLPVPPQEDGQETVKAPSAEQQDDTLVSAQFVGADVNTELAVLSVKKSDVADSVQRQVKTAVLGDSDSLKIGERAVAIGDALGYGQSVTQGIISALGRQMKSAYGIHEYIQTDASINYGNYGGALLNLDGEVIGINAGKISADSTEGMGYALPVNDAKEGIENILSGKGLSLNEVKGENAGAESGSEDSSGTQSEVQSEAQSENGIAQEQSETETLSTPSGQTQSAEDETSSSQHGLLGIHGATLSEENQIIYRVPAGVYVTAVEAGSGADLAGIEVDDVITSIDGTEITTTDELKEILSSTKAGDTVTVGVIRKDGSGSYRTTETFSVTLQ